MACISLAALALSLNVMAEQKDGVVAMVNGKAITASMLKSYQKSRGFIDNISKKQQTQMMIEELINRELIYQDAVNNGIDKRKEVQDQIDLLTKNVVAGAMLKNITQSGQISEDELKQEYQKHKNEMVTKEYKARHILVEKEDTAKNIVAKLDKGADFGELAKKESTGPSATHGGDLGWFKPGEMVKEFSDAVEKLENGKYTKTPVKTQFGWHVILRENARDIPPPPFEQMREQLKMRAQNIQIEQYIGSLRDKATIKRH